ncbi:MAG: ABC transporter permease [Planctomycetota bacterium]
MAIATTLKKISTGYSLAWKKEANWTSPPVYLAYSLTRPLAGAMLIWLMATVAGRPPGYLLPAWYSLAAFQIVPAVLGGTSWAILEDRERYQMLKYVYLAPGSAIPYLSGHALARAAQSLFGAVALAAFGAFVLGLRPPEFHPLLLTATLVLGVTLLLFLGLALAGASLHFARHGHFMTESIGGVFLLCSAAIFPVDILPLWMRPVTYASPVTWWLELVRRSLGLKFGSVLSGYSTALILGILGAFCALSIAMGFYGWAVGERKAKWKGLLDATTAY